MFDRQSISSFSLSLSNCIVSPIGVGFTALGMTNDTSDDEPGAKNSIIHTTTESLTKTPFVSLLLDLCPIIPYKPDSGGSPDSQYPLTPSSRGSLSQSIKPSAKGPISAKSVAPSQQEQDGGMDNDVQLAEGLSEDLKEKAGSRRSLGVQGENKGEETGPPVKKAKTTHGTHASEERKTRFGSKPPESDGVEVAEEDNAMCVGGADEETTVRSDGDEGEVEDFEPRSVKDKGLEKKTTLAARMAPWNGATRRGSSGSGNTKASRKSAKGKEEENTREEEEDQGGAASARELDGLHEEIAQVRAFAPCSVDFLLTSRPIAYYAAKRTNHGLSPSNRISPYS